METGKHTQQEVSRGQEKHCNGQKCAVLKIAKSMAKTNQGIIGENCMRNDNGTLEASDKYRKIAWKSDLEKILRVCIG